MWIATVVERVGHTASIGTQGWIEPAVGCCDGNRVGRLPDVFAGKVLEIQAIAAPRPERTTALGRRPYKVPVRRPEHLHMLSGDHCVGHYQVGSRRREADPDPVATACEVPPGRNRH